MSKVIDSTNLGYLIGKIKAAFWAKGDTSELPIDAVPTASSNNLAKSGGIYDAIQGVRNYPLAAGVTAWNTEVRAGSATPSVTLPAPSVTLPAPAGTGVAEEIRYTFTAATAAASFTAPSGYILGDEDGFAGLTAGNTLSYSALTVGSIYECSFAVLDATHISLVMKEHKTA